MNRIIIKIFFIIVFQLTNAIFSNGQQNQNGMSHESIVLFSDRTLYIAGEQILLSASVQSYPEINQTELSRVLYCELISPDGNKITGNKYLIKNTSSFGYLVIPDDITTGIYYLRAYTKFMRNFSPFHYYYLGIKIVNANRSEVQTLRDNNHLPKGLLGEENPEIIDGSFHISTDKSQYASRERVHISIDLTDSAQASWIGLNLAVVPEFSVSQNKVNLPDNGQFEQRIFYFPETRGLSLTGKLADNNNGNPLPYTRVNLSVIGRGHDFMALKTDTLGRFFFSLPYYTGFRDLFLSTENSITSDAKILIDNDYCTIPVHIPSRVFTLTNQERLTAYNMAVNVQLKSYFKDDSIPDTINNQHEGETFYGKPDEILYIDNYIHLSSLEEYFNELLTLAKVRMHQGKKYFKVLGSQTGLTDLEPLTLVDLVAIDNPAKVLAILPLNISRIEVVNQLYVKGDQTYGGIINIITKRGDFAGIDLPSSGVFLNYGFLADSSQNPKNYPPIPHSPDPRNTLFWAPKLVLNKSKNAKVTFTTSDTPGKYLIILNGINSKGEIFRQTSSIKIIN